MKVYHDPIIPGWPWILEKDDGQLSHHTTEERAREYRDWLAGQEEDASSENRPHAVEGGEEAKRDADTAIPDPASER